jgi:hypothetical protein
MQIWMRAAVGFQKQELRARGQVSDQIALRFVAGNGPGVTHASRSREERGQEVELRSSSGASGHISS